MNLSQVAAQLQSGGRVTFRASGHSMEPIIRHQSLVTLDSFTGRATKGDIVLAKVKGRYYLHRVGAVRGNQVLIENAKGRPNGWTPLDHVLGRLVFAVSGNVFVSGTQTGVH